MERNVSEICFCWEELLMNTKAGGGDFMALHSSAAQWFSSWRATIKTEGARATRRLKDTDPKRPILESWPRARLFRYLFFCGVCNSLKVYCIRDDEPLLVSTNEPRELGCLIKMCMALVFPFLPFSSFHPPFFFFFLSTVFLVPFLS